MTANFELLQTGLLPAWIRGILIVAAIGTTGLVFYKDFKDLEVPGWTPYLCGIPIVLFWVYVVYRSFTLTHVAIAGFVFYIGYAIAKAVLYIVSSLTNVGGGDVTYAVLLALLLPSPVLWGSPFSYIPSKFGFAPVDYIINVALVFVIGGIAAKIYARLKEKPVVIPFTPAVAGAFTATVLFGALWRPVLMPLIELAVGLF